MSMASGPAHRSVSNIRPSPSPNSAGPGSPHTPPGSRTVSATLGSPSTLRAEEETIIFDIGTRYLRAGAAGDTVPQAIISYGPEEQRRAGDYRRWSIDYEKDWRRREVGCKEWGEKHELWKLDLRELDLGLVGDKIGKAIREAYTKFLLLDSRSRRMVLVLPSLLPLPLLSTILDTLFEGFQPPTISLLSSPLLTTFAAGLRAALVVDIGWAETVMTGIYEYREIQSSRSVRASKWLGHEMLKTLAVALQGSSTEPQAEDEQEEQKYRDIISFEECEEVTYRMAWCKSLPLSKDTQESPETITSIPLKSTQPPTTLKLPFSKLAEPCERAFFASHQPPIESDDNELPLPTLLYNTLLHLPLDVRSLCMSRIIFTGGSSQIPGLRSRILSEVQKIIDERGWDPVVGRAADIVRAKNRERPASNMRNKQSNSGPTEVSTAERVIPKIISGEEESELERAASQIPAALQPQETDPITEHLTLQNERTSDPPPIHGVLRSVDSLGAWAGASLLSMLKIPPISIIERETWVSQGFGGAKKVGEMDFTGVSVGKRQSMGAGLGRAGGTGVAGDRSSWTLGGFA